MGILYEYLIMGNHKRIKMALIRCGEEGYNAYIYMSADRHLQFYTPSFSGEVYNYYTAKFVIETLIEKKEVPPSMLDRLMVDEYNRKEPLKERDWEKLFHDTVVITD